MPARVAALLVVVCAHAAWADAPSVNCGAFNAAILPPGGVMPSCATTTEGTVCTATCDDGLNVVGDSSYMCMPTGVWSGTCFECNTWHVLNDNAYYLNKDFAEPNKKFRHAQAHCESMGAQLASVHSVEEVNFLAGLDSLPRPVWLGGRRDRPAGGPPFTFFWLDGTAFDILALYPECPGANCPLWRVGEPDDNLNRENCLKMGKRRNGDIGMWGDGRCGSVRSYICKRTGLWRDF
jgi:hypothetical protein